MDLITVLRVVISLAVVFGALWFFQRRLTKRSGGRGRKSAPLTVLGRVNLGGKASAVVVESGGSRLVLGVTEHGVSVLATEPLVAGNAEAAPLTEAAVRESAPAVADLSERVRMSEHVAAASTGMMLRRVEQEADTESIRLPSAEELAADWAQRSANVSPIAPKRHRVTFIRDAAGNPATLDGVRESFERIRGAISR